MKPSAVVLFACSCMIPVSSAFAQDTIRVAFGLWNPHADIILESDGNGVPGTPIDLRQDAGLADDRVPVVDATFRIAARHKVHFEYVPIAYDSSATLMRDVVFTGAQYPRGSAVTSTFDWKSYGVGYEYDFLVRPRWTAGLVVEARQTDIEERLSTASISEARRTHVPAPLVGGAFQIKPLAYVSVTGRVTGFKVPNSADRHYGGHYLDAQMTAAVDLTHAVADASRFRFGIEGGYRVIDIFHLGEADSATMTLKGPYVGAVVSR